MQTRITPNDVDRYAEKACNRINKKHGLKSNAYCSKIEIVDGVGFVTIYNGYAEDVHCTNFSHVDQWENLTDKVLDEHG